MKRPLFVCCLVFAVSILASVFLLDRGMVLIADATFAVSGVVCIVFGRKKRAFRIISTVILSMTVGFSWFFVYTEWIMPKGEIMNTEIRAIVTRSGNGYVEARLLQADGKSDRISKRVSIWSDEVLSVGDIVSGKAEIVPCNYTGKAIGYDYSVTNGIRAKIYADDAWTVETDDEFHLFLLPAKLYDAFRVKIREMLPNSVAELGVAIVTGDKSGLPDGYTDCLRDAGLTHMAAVSGMHMGFLVSLLAVVFGKKWGVLLSPAVLLVFAAMVGFSPSVVRSMIMTVFSGILWSMRKDYDSLTGIGVALLLILLVNPFAAADIGLQYSFAATISIAIFTRPAGNMVYAVPIRNKTLNRLRVPFARTFGSAFAAMLASAPISAIYYGSFPLVTLFSNIAASLAVNIGFCATLIAGAFDWISAPIGEFIGRIAGLFLGYLDLIVTGAAKLSRFSVGVGTVYYAVPVLIAVVAVFAALAWKGKRRIVALTVFCVAVVSYLGVETVEKRVIMPSTLECVVTDTEHGQCVILRNGNETAVVDCGMDCADDCVRWLRSHNIHSVDRLVLTHYRPVYSGDADKLNSLIEIQSSVGMTGTDAPTFLTEKYTTEKSFLLGNATLTLVPEPAEKGSKGFVVICSLGGKHVVISAGADADGTREAIRRLASERVSLLILGRRGAKPSTSDDLLSRTDAVAVSVNRYGLAKETLVRIVDMNLKLYRTDCDGTIEMRFSNGKD